MRSVISLGLLFFAMSFCGLSDRLKQMAGSGGTNTNTAGANSSSSSSSSSKAEKPTLTGSQQAVIDGGSETKWDDQGAAWTLPKNWKKMDVKKETFNYQSPDNAFLLVNISILPDDFPMDISMKASYDQALQQLKNGKYESVRMLEIDGVPGVEFTEAAPEDKDGVRRHQWIGFRNYLGQKQQLNVMLSTRGTNFERHRDDFTAIMYSMKVT